MELRRVSIADVDGIFALRMRGLKDSPSAFLTTYDEEHSRGIDFYRKVLNQPGDDNVIFAAFSEGMPIAMVGLVRSERSKTRHKGVIWGMYVDPIGRRQGLGGKLIDMALEHARKKLPLTAVFLSVEATNSEARRLYEKRGFSFWGCEPRAMSEGGSYFDEDHMVLLL